MKTRKIHCKTLWLCLTLCTWLFSSCSKEEQRPSQTAPHVTVQNMQFSFTEIPFGDDQEVTRSQLQEPAHFTDLGNDLEAEATVEREYRPATRAPKPISDGHYTIYAVKGGQRVQNALIRGTISTQAGGKKVFTPDANTSSLMQIPANETYTFVCINDGVTMQADGRLLISNKEKARIGTTTQTISGKEWKVAFEMKPCAARIRIMLTATWALLNIQGDLLSAVAQPQTISYDVEGKNPQTTTPATNVGRYGFANAGAIAAAGSSTLSTPSNQFLYVAPGTNANVLYLRYISGELYRKGLANVNFPFRKFPATLKAGDSFTYKTKIYRSFIYLFSDGSTGTLAANPTKTPIAAVVSPSGSTTVKNGLAMALTDAGAPVVWSTIAAQRNPQMFINFNAAYNTYTGYTDTYNTGHWNDATTPAFYAAAHYNVARPSNTEPWFLPALGQWKLSFIALGNLNAVTITDFGGPSASSGWDMNLYNSVFVQAKGTAHNRWYWSSTEHTAGTTLHVVIYGQDTPYQTWFAGNDKTTPLMYIRPFLHFSNKP